MLSPSVFRTLKNFHTKTHVTQNWLRNSDPDLISKQMWPSPDFNPMITKPMLKVYHRPISEENRRTQRNAAGNSVTPGPIGKAINEILR